MPASMYSGNGILNLLLRGVAFTAPAAGWVSLHTAAPGDDGEHEVSVIDWPSYVRLDAANGGDVEEGFLPASNKASVNGFDLLYPAYDGSAPLEVTHFAVWDAETNGNCLVTGILALGGVPAPKTLLPTDELVIRAGNLVVTVN